MTTQIRDTQLGHLVRFLSCNRLLRYPDEKDPSLWRKFLQPDTTSKSSQQEDQNVSADPFSMGFDTQNDDVHDSSVNHVVKEGKDIYLVTWYGADDPEVTAPTDPMRLVTKYLTHVSESAELAIQLENTDHFSNLYNKLVSLPRKFHLRAWRVQYHERVWH